VPIYNGGIFKRQQQVASINTKNATLQKEGTLLDFKSNAVKTYQSYTAGIAQAATQQNTYKLSAQLVALALQRYQLAQATIIELREAQKSFEDAGYRFINLNYTAKIAEIELKRLAGKLGL
jgi:outer membrane protein